MFVTTANGTIVAASSACLRILLLLTTLSVWFKPNQLLQLLLRHCSHNITVTTALGEITTAGTNTTPKVTITFHYNYVYRDDVNLLWGLLYPCFEFDFIKYGMVVA